MSSPVEPYTLDPAFEAALVAYLIQDRKVFGALRPGLEPDAFPTKSARILVQMCLRLFDETGQGPGSCVAVAQRLNHYHAEEGRLTLDDLAAAVQFMDDAIDADNKPSPEMVVAQFVPQIQERMRGDILRDALMGLDTKEMRRRLEVAETVGFVDTNLGAKLGTGSFQDIAGLRLMEKIPTGVVMLDQRMEGGAPRGQLWVWAGDSNAGKSTALGQQTGACIREGGLTLYGTNELPAPMIKAKIFADLTNVPFKNILNGTQLREAEERYTKLSGLGDLYVKELDAHITTPTNIDDWRKEVEDQEGRPVDLITVDYADLMAPGVQNTNDYSMYKHIYIGLRDIAQNNHMVVATASQAKAKVNGQKYIQLNDLSDSRHKGRSASVVVSLNWDPDDEQMTLFICKQKLGAANVPVGPFPAEWEFGRISRLPDRVRNGTRPSADWAAQDVSDALNPFNTSR